MIDRILNSVTWAGRTIVEVLRDPSGQQALNEASRENRDAHARLAVARQSKIDALIELNEALQEKNEALVEAVSLRDEQIFTLQSGLTSRGQYRLGKTTTRN